MIPTGIMIFFFQDEEIVEVKKVIIIIYQAIQIMHFLYRQGIAILQIILYFPRKLFRKIYKIITVIGIYGSNCLIC